MWCNDGVVDWGLKGFCVVATAAAAAMADKGLFANDGSFMERFKQMQEKEKEKAAAASSSAAAAAKATNPKPVVVAANTPSASKRPLELKGGEVKKAGSISSGAKLAFSLKKNKVAVAPVKFAADDEDEEDVGADREEPVKRQKYAQPEAPASVAALSGVVGNHLFTFVPVIAFFSCDIVSNTFVICLLVTMGYIIVHLQLDWNFGFNHWMYFDYNESTIEIVGIHHYSVYSFCPWFRLAH